MQACVYADVTVSDDRLVCFISCCTAVAVGKAQAARLLPGHRQSSSGTGRKALVSLLPASLAKDWRKRETSGKSLDDDNVIETVSREDILFCQCILKHIHSTLFLQLPLLTATIALGAQLVQRSVFHGTTSLPPATLVREERLISCDFPFANQASAARKESVSLFSLTVSASGAHYLSCK